VSVLRELLLPSQQSEEKEGCSEERMKVVVVLKATEEAISL
jgi:hypothetical protein